MDGSVDFPAARVFTVIPGSRDNHNAGIDQGSRSPACGIIPVSTDRRSPKAHINDADIVFVLIKRIC